MLRYKLISEYFVTNRAVSFIQDTMDSSTITLLEDIDKKLSEEGVEETKSFIRAIVSSLNASDSSEIDTMIEPEKIVYGYKMVKDKMKEQAMYRIPLEKSIDLFWQDEKMRNVMKEHSNSPTDQCEIKIALYHDEVNLLCPIGVYR